MTAGLNKKYELWLFWEERIEKDKLKELIEEQFLQIINKRKEILEKWNRFKEEYEQLWKEHIEYILNFLYDIINRKEYEIREMELYERRYWDNNQRRMIIENDRRKFYLYKFNLDNNEIISRIFVVLRRLYQIKKYNNEYHLNIQLNLDYLPLEILKFKYNDEQRRKVIVKMRNKK